MRKKRKNLIFFWIFKTYMQRWNDKKCMKNMHSNMCEKECELHLLHFFATSLLLAQLCIISHMFSFFPRTSTETILECSNYLFLLLAFSLT